MAGLRLQALTSKVLRPVDLEVAGGELLFLSGPSGAGKTLLLRAIADLDPHQGEAWLDGVARSAMAPPEWRRRVGLLPAESHWWAEQVSNHFPVSFEAGTLLEQLAFGPEVLHWSIARLSTGERQRLALARLLAVAPEALLLDEATANLDPPNRGRVELIIQNYRREHGAAVIWVSHDPDQRRRLGGRHLVVRDGGLQPAEDAVP
jgi:ABC-type iron transport system FetAB ATPase subunit